MITKASGEIEPFSVEKLRRSLGRVNAPSSVIDQVVEHIQNELKPGMPTYKIYRHAFSLLRKGERPTAARYSLKQAIRELGPSGHPFEKLVAELLLAQGFSVEVGKIMQGACISHEVDVIAQKDNRYVMVECKFHNQPSIKSDVKVALYVWARFLDLEKVWKRLPEHAGKSHEAWLVTNTKLTHDAVKYAKCIGMKAIGWKYPRGEGLEFLIERSGLHPVTSLTTLSRSQKNQLVARGIIMCKELFENKKAFDMVGVRPEKVPEVLREIETLCKDCHV